MDKCHRCNKELGRYEFHVESSLLCSMVCVKAEMKDRGLGPRTRISKLRNPWVPARPNP